MRSARRATAICVANSSFPGMDCADCARDTSGQRRGIARRELRRSRIWHGDDAGRRPTADVVPGRANPVRGRAPRLPRRTTDRRLQRNSTAQRTIARRTWEIVIAPHLYWSRSALSVFTDLQYVPPILHVTRGSDRRLSRRSGGPRLDQSAPRRYEPADDDRRGRRTRPAGLGRGEHAHGPLRDRAGAPIGHNRPHTRRDPGS